MILLKIMTECFEMDHISINVYDFCFICFEQYDKNHLILKCCKTDLHKPCLLVWILYDIIDTRCPICRKKICINDIFKINDIITCYNLLDINIRQSNIKKIEKLVSEYYYHCILIHDSKYCISYNCWLTIFCC